MKTILIVLVLMCFFHGAPALRCFQCFFSQYPYHFSGSRTVRTCENLDFSSDFIVDCPTSRFCYKKTAKASFYSTQYSQEERGCAPQLYRGQNFDYTQGWSADVHVVANAYSNGCKAVDTQGLKSSSEEECYCDGDLCNSSSKIKRPWLLLIVCLLLVLNE